MCIIVDNDVGPTFFKSQQGELYFPALEWIRKKGGKLVMGAQLWEEYQDRRRAETRRANVVRELERAGQAFFYSKAMTQAEEVKVTSKCKSDDPHIIALARVSGARVLCTKDKKLKDDFKNLALVNSPGGHIYETAADSEHLHHRHGCPYPPPAR